MLPNNTHCLVCEREVIVLTRKVTVTPEGGEPRTGYVCRDCANPHNDMARLALIYEPIRELRRRQMKG